MNKPDFNKRMLELCRTVTPGEKLLLHSCCGPCSSRCLETLKEYLLLFCSKILFLQRSGDFFQKRCCRKPFPVVKITVTQYVTKL